MLVSMKRATEAANARCKRTMRMRHSLPHTSQAALAACIKYAREHDISDLPITRQGIGISKAIMNNMNASAYGELLITIALKTTGCSKHRSLYILATTRRPCAAMIFSKWVNSGLGRGQYQTKANSVRISGCRDHQMPVCPPMTVYTFDLILKP